MLIIVVVVVVVGGGAVVGPGQMLNCVVGFVVVMEWGCVVRLSLVVLVVGRWLLVVVDVVVVGGGGAGVCVCVCVGLGRGAPTGRT